MDYLRWKMEVLRYAWKSFWHGLREYVRVELGVIVAGAIAGLFTGGDPIGAAVGGVVAALVFGVAIGLHSLIMAPYRLYRDNVAPDPSVLRRHLENTAMIGRRATGLPTVSDWDIEQWAKTAATFVPAFAQCSPLLGKYEFDRIGNATYDPKVRYPDRLDENQGALWLHIQAVVAAIDRKLEAMDSSEIHHA